jgi:hypothetical protein
VKKRSKRNWKGKEEKINARAEARRLGALEAEEEEETRKKVSYYTATAVPPISLCV